MSDLYRLLLLLGIAVCIFVAATLVDMALNGGRERRPPRAWLVSLGLCISASVNLMYLIEDIQRDSCESHVIYRGECLPGQDPLSVPGETVRM